LFLVLEYETRGSLEFLQKLVEESCHGIKGLIKLLIFPVIYYLLKKDKKIYFII
jgi:hypothetical protein